MLSAVDLFAGPGGLGEGFWQAGFEVVCSVERDRWAAETLRTRHLYRLLARQKKVEEYERYLRGEISREVLLERYPEIAARIKAAVIQETLSPATRFQVLQRLEASLREQGITDVDVLLGGPPCELYSLIGRARYAPMQEKYWQDERLGLYGEYVFFLRELKPRVFVFENVEGILSAVLKDGCPVLQSFIEAVHEAGYELFPSLHEREPFSSPRENGFRGYVLNALDFGVPQRRRRVILVGYRRGSGGKNFDFYGHLYERYALRDRCYTVRDAIADLPSLRPGEGNDRWYGSYETPPPSEYARRLREGSLGILNHRARPHMAADLERYRYFIERSLEGKRADLLSLQCDAPHLLPCHRNLKGFIDRFRVQVWGRPASTITSHLARDGHYYIHPDPAQCRSFTVREAARCQSFPDNYLFEGPKTAQFKQVGSAVPPLMAHQIALGVRDFLTATEEEGKEWDTSPQR